GGPLRRRPGHRDARRGGRGLPRRRGAGHRPLPRRAELGGGSRRSSPPTARPSRCATRRTRSTAPPRSWASTSPT
ncbi:hypothetical protein D9C01_13880, partial [Corynebacterium diphtheriae]